jgi:CBS domain-containing protein
MHSPCRCRDRGRLGVCFEAHRNNEAHRLAQGTAALDGRPARFMRGTPIAAVTTRAMFIPSFALNASRAPAMRFAVLAPPTARPEDTVEDARRQMQRARVECLAVVDEDHVLVGIMTRRDLDRAVVSFQCPGDAIPLAWAMTSELHTVGSEASLADAAAIMERHRVRRVPIVNTHRQLIGLVSLSIVERVWAEARAA